MPVASLFQHIKHSAHEGLNMLLPPLCVACEAMVSDTHGFCGGCWASFAFIASPMCSCCGLPFEYDPHTVDGTLLCGTCLEETAHFSKARSVLVYNDASKQLILPFKHSDRTDYARAMGRLMYNAGRSLLEEADALVPVPLHVFRLFERRYNQSALLVHELCKLSGRPMMLHVLRRHKATGTQGHLSKEQRKKNVQNAFSIHPKTLASLKDKKLLLIDDVFTTGATVNACAQTLRKAGAAEVNVLTLARVVKIQ